MGKTPIFTAWLTFGRQTSKICRVPARPRAGDETEAMPRLNGRPLLDSSHHAWANAFHSLRCCGSIPHRWPRPLPSIRSMKVVWSCSSLCATARRIRHSAIVAMPLGVARTATAPVFLSVSSPKHDVRKSASTSMQSVATRTSACLKALYPASSPRTRGAGSADHTQSTSEMTTWIRSLRIASRASSLRTPSERKPEKSPRTYCESPLTEV
mmetsp:Transcript_37813/g.88480  ORF Transcript_37813/g.88480 Transcript_37813/m.88480 type:complete len:211 (+) Transcript_37813:656-1288(+)